MPNDSYENLPRVNFSVNTKEFELLRAKAQALARMGMPEAMAEFNREYARAKTASKIFIRNAAAEEVDEAQKIESQKVGHSKSGYVPTGTLQGSITPEFSEDGMKVSVVPLATSEDADEARKQIKQGAKKVRKVNKPSKNKDAYYYGTAVEFGKGHNPKEPFMKPSGEKVAARLDKKFEDTMRKALE
ncbi:hypothetical protein KSL82_09585 [Limosilactobacillus portuensis]|jgi:hypothetical protein|uniref:Phage protein, HK97 gp10 family n=1 Tax=Limosilactobacillus portuensis TaxID=2742601 RepID=A0ABS6IX75_9LACO|nr:hypothetical protein [Limosilactobacillus portuensis]PMC27359.1 hypothetical protein CJ225_05880 [Gardnerella vaginalis]